MLKRIIIKGLMLATAISANINIYSVSAATKDNLSEKESVYIVDVKNKAGLNKIINNYSDDIVKTLHIVTAVGRYADRRCGRRTEISDEKNNVNSPHNTEKNHSEKH